MIQGQAAADVDGAQEVVALDDLAEATAEVKRLVRLVDVEADAGRQAPFEGSGRGRVNDDDGGGVSAGRERLVERVEGGLAQRLTDGVFEGAAGHAAAEEDETGAVDQFLTSRASRTGTRLLRLSDIRSGRTTPLRMRALLID